MSFANALLSLKDNKKENFSFQGNDFVMNKKELESFCAALINSKIKTLDLHEFHRFLSQDINYHEAFDKIAKAITQNTSINSLYLVLDLSMAKNLTYIITHNTSIIAFKFYTARVNFQHDNIPDDVLNFFTALDNSSSIKNIEFVAFDQEIDFVLNHFFINIYKNKNFESINLANSFINFQALRNIFGNEIGKINKLKKLSLENTNWGTLDNFFEPVELNINLNSQISELNLGAVNFDQKHFNAFVHFCLNYLKHLTKLSLPYTNIDDVMMKDLALLMQKPGINFLDLRCNQFTSKGLIYLVEALSKQKNLTELKLDPIELKLNNNIGIDEKGVNALAGLISMPFPINFLDICKINFSDSSWSNLITAINLNPLVHGLTIDHIDVDGELRKNRFLGSISFQEESEKLNSQQIYEEINALLRYNCNLQKVYCRNLDYGCQRSGYQAQLLINILLAHMLKQHAFPNIALNNEIYILLKLKELLTIMPERDQVIKLSAEKDSDPKFFRYTHFLTKALKENYQNIKPDYRICLLKILLLLLSVESQQINIAQPLIDHVELAIEILNSKTSDLADRYQNLEAKLRTFLKNEKIKINSKSDVLEFLVLVLKDLENNSKLLDIDNHLISISVPSLTDLASSVVSQELSTPENLVRLPAELAESITHASTHMQTLSFFAGNSIIKNKTSAHSQTNRLGVIRVETRGCYEIVLTKEISKTSKGR